MAYFVSLMNGEESSFWLKILMCDFSSLSIANFYTKTLHGRPPGESCTTNGLQSLKGVAIKGSNQSDRLFFSHMCISSPCAFILKCLHLKSWICLLQFLCWDLLMGEGRGNLEDIFPSTFLLLTLPAFLLLIIGSIKLPEPFILAPSTVKWPLGVCWSIWTSLMCCSTEENKNRRNRHFLLFDTFTYTITESDQGFKCFVFSLLLQSAILTPSSLAL